VIVSEEREKMHSVEEEQYHAYGLRSFLRRHTGKHLPVVHDGKEVLYHGLATRLLRLPRLFDSHSPFQLPTQML